MKKLLTASPVILLLILNLTGCTTVGDKSGSLSIVYGVAALLSLLILSGYCIFVRKKNVWFVSLFSSVLVVNTGYTLLSVSSCLKWALWANRVSYLGSVFLPLSMLMIILNVTNTPYKKRLSGILLGVSVLVFLITATPGVLPIYYKEVSFAVINGVSTLVKVYGPLHSLYLVYLLGYFVVMVTVIVRAHMKKTIDTTSHAVIIATAVFVNIGVWFIEQLVSIDFEMLSISYIISELFLLGAHIVMNENQRLREIVKQVEAAKNYSQKEIDSPDEPIDNLLGKGDITPEHIEIFMSGIKKLTPTEKTIYDAHISRLTTNEIMANLNIKESTLKYHNRNIYGKLCVTSRKELLELHKHIKSVKAKLESADSHSDKQIK